MVPSQAIQCGDCESYGVNPVDCASDQRGSSCCPICPTALVLVVRSLDLELAYFQRLGGGGLDVFFRLRHRLVTRLFRTF